MAMACGDFRRATTERLPMDTIVPSPKEGMVYDNRPVGASTVMGAERRSFSGIGWVGRTRDDLLVSPFLMRRRMDDDAAIRNVSTVSTSSNCYDYFSSVLEMVDVVVSCNKKALL
jgi:hypothetical protein